MKGNLKGNWKGNLKNVRKYIVVFLSVFLMMGSSIALGAPGDFFHAGLERHYDLGSPSARADLIRDLKDTSIDKEDFYREIEGGKYVNVLAEEGAHSAKLEDLLSDNDLALDDPVAIKNFFTNTDNDVVISDFRDQLNLETQGLEKTYDEILGDIGDLPKVEASKDESIVITLTASTSKSGFSVLSELNPSDDLGDLDPTWRLAVLDHEPGVVYKSDSFNGIDYEENLQIRIASNDELDNMDSSFKKYIIIYGVVDGEIDSYNIVDVLDGEFSGALEASLLTMKLDDTSDYHYSEPEKGAGPNSVQIKELKGLDEFSASRWACVVGHDLEIPLLDRPLTESLNYVAGADIIVQASNDLLILAIDSNNLVKAYGLVENLNGDMIKNPLAVELRETSHYTKPVKGLKTGSSKISFLKYEGVSNWKYLIKDEPMASPEMDSVLSGASELNIDIDILVETDDAELKADEGFSRNMTIYGLDDHDKVKVFKSFTMNNSNVKMPGAEALESLNVGPLIKGNVPNTSRIERLDHIGLSSSKFRYKLLDAEPDEIEFNQVVSGTSELKIYSDISVRTGKYFLILAVDDSYRVKAYTYEELTFDNVRAGKANDLMPTTNYKGPFPGDENNTSSFSFLGLPNNGEKWLYKLGDSSFGSLESGAKIEKDGDKYLGYEEYTGNTDIDGVAIGDYLLLLAIDVDHKVLAYKEFLLKTENVKGSLADELDNQAYSLMQGSSPSTSRLMLEPIGLDNPDSIRWRYKLLDAEASEDKDKPYFDQVVEDTTIYNVNFSSKIGSDILVNKLGDDYGYILILASDYSGRTKAFKYVKITEDDVKEHAGDLECTITSVGADNDCLIVKGLDSEVDKSFKYLISDTKPVTPSVGDFTPSGSEAYVLDSNIKIKIGRYLTIYKVDVSGKIISFRSFLVDEVAQKTANIEALTLLEGSIRGGGSRFTVTLVDNVWEDVVNDKAIRDELFRGLKADNESTQWDKLVNSLIADGRGAISRSSDVMITISLPENLDYNISQEQMISLTIPFEAIVGAINPIKAAGHLLIKPTIDATISGDVVTSIVRESHIKEGGKTIIVELTDGTWILDLQNDEKMKLIDGFSGGSNWNQIKEEIKKDLNKYIKRNSGSKLTITLPSIDDVDFASGVEVISLTIYKYLIPGSEEIVVASPNFTLYPDILKIEGEAEDNEVSLLAPEYRLVDLSKDTWTIKLDRGTFRDDISIDDFHITGLPRGLNLDISSEESKTLKIKVSGTASSDLSASGTIVKIKIKSSAVSEANSIESDEIHLKLIRSGSMIDLLKAVRLNVVDNKLMNTNGDMAYSLDSTNGINGEWHDCGESVDSETSKTFTDISSAGGFVPGKVFVKEKANPRVFYEVANLIQGKAPTNFNLGQVSYNEGIKVKINVKEDENKYEYSKNGGENWSALDSSAFISLDDSSDLRLRYKASIDGLASQISPKINLLDLRNVDINVLEGKIEGTSLGMEYRLNPSGTFVSARANETPNVPFDDGNVVVIRDRANPENLRELGEVGKEVEPEVAGADYSILAGSITVNIAEGKIGQYRIGSDSWKDLGLDGEKIEFKAGQVQVRTRASKMKVASEPIDVGEVILNPESKASLRVDDFNKEISYWDEEAEIWKKLELEDTLKYKINDGEWKDSSEWANDKYTDIIKNTNANVSIRVKASQYTLPSQIALVNFTGNLTWENVKLNVVEGKIEGTRRDMEYSLDSSDGRNGTWLGASSPSTNVDFRLGMIVYIREKSKPLNFSQLSNGVDIEAKLGEDDVDYHIGDGSISNLSSRMVEYRFNNGKWNVLDRASGSENYTLYGINFEVGNLYFRARATENTLPSLPISVAIKARKSAPNLRYDDVNYEIESIGPGGNVNYEYSVNGGPWTLGNIDTRFEGGDIIKIRLGAKDDTLASQEQSIVLTQNLDLNNVILNVPESKLMNTSSLMEYSKDSSNGENGIWIPCSAGETKLSLQEGMSLYVREKVKARNYRKVSEDPIGKKDFPNGDNFVKNRLDFNILEKTISILSPVAPNQSIVNDLQYRINKANWINVDFVKLEAGITKVLVYNVNFVPGDLEFRLRGDENTLPSDSILKATIKARLSAPDVSVGFDKLRYRNEVVFSGILSPEEKLDRLKQVEYSLVGINGPWLDGGQLENDNLVGDVYIRTKAQAGSGTSISKLASLSRKLSFSPVLNLKSVVLSTHVKPFELNGVTENMEYRLNGDSSEWRKCEPDGEGNSFILRRDGGKLDTLAPITKIEIRDAKETGNTITIYP